MFVARELARRYTRYVIACKGCQTAEFLQRWVCTRTQVDAGCPGRIHVHLLCGRCGWWTIVKPVVIRGRKAAKRLAKGASLNKVASGR